MEGWGTPDEQPCRVPLGVGLTGNTLLRPNSAVSTCAAKTCWLSSFGILARLAVHTPHAVPATSCLAWSATTLAQAVPLVTMSTDWLLFRLQSMVLCLSVSLRFRLPPCLTNKWSSKAPRSDTPRMEVLAVAGGPRSQPYSHCAFRTDLFSQSTELTWTPHSESVCLPYLSACLFVLVSDVQNNLHFYIS